MNQITPSYPDMESLVARKNAITARIRAVNPVEALEARDRIPETTFWIALRLAATRRDLFDGLAHVRCLHERTEIRVEWLARVLESQESSIDVVAIEAAIACGGSHPAFVAWAHACIDDEIWEVVSAARRILGGGQRDG